MSNKNILDGFVPRRSKDSSNSYQAPLTGAPSELNDFKSSQNSPTTRKEKHAAKNSRGASDTSWQDSTLKNSVLSGARSSSSLNDNSPDLSDKNRKRNKRTGGPRTKKQKIKRVIKFALIPLLLVGGYYLYNLMNLSGKVFDGNPLGFLKSTKLRGEDKGRVNVY